MKHQPDIRSKAYFSYLAIAFTCLLMLACDLPKLEDSLLPSTIEASFTASPASGNAPLTVNITNTTAEAVAFAWSFGDGAGSTSMAENPGSHTYTVPGNYELRLIVTDENGSRDTAFTTIIVSQAGATPEAGFTITNNGCTGPCTPLFINTSLNGNSYSWNFGDPDSGADNTSAEVSPSHEYTRPGTYSVKLIATNGSNVDSVTQIVTIGGIRFEKTFAGYGPGAKARQLSDGGFIIAGTENSNAYLLRTNAAGEIVSQKIYTGYDALVNDVIQLSDGTFVVTGSSYNAATTNSDVFYLRAGSDLAALNGPVRIGETDGDEGAWSVIELTDGSVLMTGYSTVTATGNSDVYVARFSPNLSTTYFKKRITAPDNEAGFDAIELSDGFVIVGEMYSSPNPSNAMFLKLDNNGNKVSGFPKAIGGSGDESAKSVVKTAAGELMLCGSITVSGGSQSDIWLQKTSLSGSTLGAAITFGSAESDYGNDIDITSEGYVIAGSAGLDSYLAKVNTSGVKTLDKTFTANGTEAFSSVQQTADGGFVLCGFKNSILYLVKTDKDGKAN